MRRGASRQKTGRPLANGIITRMMDFHGRKATQLGPLAGAHWESDECTPVIWQHFINHPVASIDFMFFCNLGNPGENCKKTWFPPCQLRITNEAMPGLVRNHLSGWPDWSRLESQRSIFLVMKVGPEWQKKHGENDGKMMINYSVLTLPYFQTNSDGLISSTPKKYSCKNYKNIINK